MANSEMIQYFRGDGNHPIGVMVAIYDETEQSVRIGWSKCNKKDQFEKERGLKIARLRTEAGSEVAVPSSREFIVEEWETATIEEGKDFREVRVPMEKVIPNLVSQYGLFIERVVTYFKSVAPNKFIICGPADQQAEFAAHVADVRNMDIDRQAARKASENA